MSETPAASLDAAFRLIDSVTTIKDVIGAMIVDVEGEVVAQDFMSQDVREQCWPTATEFIPTAVKAMKDLSLGALQETLLQSSSMTVRAVRRDETVVVIFAEKGINLGMLNLELRNRQDMFKALVGESIVSERDRERERIFDILRKEGNLTSMVEERPDLPGLRALHGILFQAALDAGVSRDKLTHRINDINYRIYRDSLLDIGFDFFNRKTLDNYDPVLARRVVAAQIDGIAAMLVEHLGAAAQ